MSSFNVGHSPPHCLPTRKEHIVKNFFASSLVALGLWFTVNTCTTAGHAQQTSGNFLYCTSHTSLTYGGGCALRLNPPGCVGGCWIDSASWNQCDSSPNIFSYCSGATANVNYVKVNYGCAAPTWVQGISTCAGCNYADPRSAVSRVVSTPGVCN